MSKQGKRTGDEVIAAARNKKAALKAFKTGKTSVQSLQDAEDRERVARDNRMNYLEAKARGEDV